MKVNTLNANLEVKQWEKKIYSNIGFWYTWAIIKF